MSRSETESARFRTIILLHGKGGSPQGSVAQLEQEMRAQGVAAKFERRLMPHSDPNVPAERSVEALVRNPPPLDAVVIGISLGGLVACKLQETVQACDSLHVIAISSPTWADGVRLERKMPNRFAIFGTYDDVIAGRTSEWAHLAKVFEVDWLTHDTDQHKARVVRLMLDSGLL